MGRDNEIQQVLAVRSDLELDAYRLDRDEVAAVVVGAPGRRSRSVR